MIEFINARKKDSVSSLGLGNFGEFSDSLFRSATGLTFLADDIKKNEWDIEEMTTTSLGVVRTKSALPIHHAELTRMSTNNEKFDHLKTE